MCANITNLGFPNVGALNRPESEDVGAWLDGSGVAPATTRLESVEAVDSGSVVVFHLGSTCSGNNSLDTHWRQCQ